MTELWSPPWPPAVPGDPVPAVDDVDLVDEVDDATVAGLRMGAAQAQPVTDKSAHAINFRPYPIVSLGGVDVAAGTGAPAGLPMVVDGLTSSWGRERLMDQPAGGTASVSLLDLDGTWAPGRVLMGTAVTFRWAAAQYGYAGQPGILWTAPNTEPLQPVYFRGRVSGVVVRRVVTMRPDGRRRIGLRVDLTCASVQADLANRTIASAPWPQETMAARRDRILTYCSDILSAIELRNYWASTNNIAMAMDVDNRSAMELIRILYDGAGGDRMTYNPVKNAMTWVPRRQVTGWQGSMDYLAYLTVSGGHQNNAGGYSRLLNWGENHQDWEASWQDASALEDDPGAEVWREDQQSRVTRINLTYRDAVTGPTTDTTLTTLVPGTSEVSDGVRAVSVSTMLARLDMATTARDDWRAMASMEGRMLFPRPLRFDTSRVNGFMTARHARMWLSGYERANLVFLEGSYWAQFGIRPVFSPMGGRIDYRGGHWQLEAIPSPVFMEGEDRAITWAEVVPASLRATRPISWTHGRPDSQAYAWSPYMTYADMRYIGYGLTG